jgi:hypothetical protein
MVEQEPLRPDLPSDLGGDLGADPGSELGLEAERLAEQIVEDLAAVTDLTASGIEIEGEVKVTESTWVVYGNDGYGGEVVVGEYHDEAEATAVLRAAPPPGPGEDGQVT